MKNINEGSEYEAEYNGQNYTTLHAAISSARGNVGEIKLLKDVVSINSYEFTSDDNLTIDVNGYTIDTFNAEKSYENNGNVKFIDSTNADDNIYSLFSRVSAINNKNKLTLNVGIYYTDTVTVSNSGDLTVNKGNFEHVHFDNSKTLVINDGIHVKITNNKNSTLTINGGTYNFGPWKTSTGLSNSGTLNIIGGQFNLD